MERTFYIKVSFFWLFLISVKCFFFFCIRYNSVCNFRLFNELNGVILHDCLRQPPKIFTPVLRNPNPSTIFSMPDGTGKSKQSATIAENTQISLLAFSPDGANKDNNKRAQSEV